MSNAAAMYYALMAASAPKLPKQIILTSGTQWTVPDDWNNAANKIECIGAGANPTLVSSFYRGGGGGAYALKNNVALTPGANASYQIGTKSTTQSVADTWFGSTATVKAAGSIGTAGGAAASCVGDVKYSGGSTNNEAGGGGAGGPHGAGSPSSGSGGAGDAGYGGGGGTFAAGTGGAGGAGVEWGAAGSGGGGGGAGDTGVGGIGGLYGGGSGAAGNSAAGSGAPGVIVITYTPA